MVTRQRTKALLPCVPLRIIIIPATIKLLANPLVHSHPCIHLPHTIRIIRRSIFSPHRPHPTNRCLISSQQRRRHRFRADRWQAAGLLNSSSSSRNTSISRVVMPILSVVSPRATGSWLQPQQQLRRTSNSNSNSRRGRECCHLDLRHHQQLLRPRSSSSNSNNSTQRRQRCSTLQQQFPWHNIRSIRTVYSSPLRNMNSTTTASCCSIITNTITTTLRRCSSIMVGTTLTISSSQVQLRAPQLLLPRPPPPLQCPPSLAT